MTTTHLMHAVRAEWTKLRTVRSTGVALLSAVALIVLLGLLSAHGGKTSYGGPKTLDQFTYYHQPRTGDTAITVEVAAQSAGAPWAKAGVMLKADALSGSPSVSLMLTPEHGVRMQSSSTTEFTGTSHATAPYWLRLVRTGQRVTGSESADGRTWRTVGTVTAARLPATAQAGLFVASPHVLRSHRDGPRRTVGHGVSTVGRADFQQVALTPGPQSGPWRLTDVGGAPVDGDGGLPTRPRDSSGPGQEQAPPGADGPPGGVPDQDPPGTERQHGGTFTLTGSGDIGSPGIGGVGVSNDSDGVADALSGVQIALFAVIALGVLAMTSEYRTRTIRTTFTVSPRRGPVLAAKAIVLAGSVFVAGLVADVAAFLIATPVQRANGFGPPLFPSRSLTDPDVLRAVIGTAAFLALIALLSLGVGVIVRRTAAAVILLFALLVVVPLVAGITSVGADVWVNRTTPIAGAAIRHTQPLIEYAIGPWPGFAVLAAYTAATLGVAFRLQRRRDA